MSQTGGYSFQFDKAQAGVLYDLRPHTISSFAAEADLNFGAPLKRGTDPEKQVLLGDETAFVGIAVLTQTEPNALSGGTAQYDTNETVSVLQSGAIWVTGSENGIVAGDTAYVNASGEYVKTSGTTIEIGTFITGGDDGDLVVVSIG